MTDTSRPTVEALIARLRYQAGAHMGQFRSEMNGAAAVLSALLTERDELEAERDAYSDEADDWTHKWAAALDERDAARAQIAEALRRLREHEDTYGGWPQLGADLHAILFRDVQEATEPKEVLADRNAELEADNSLLSRGLIMAGDDLYAAQAKIDAALAEDALGDWEYSPTELRDSFDRMQTWLTEVTGHKGRGCGGCDICTSHAMMRIASAMFENVANAVAILSAAVVQGDAKLATNPTHPETEHDPEWVPGDGNLYCRVCGGDYGAPHNAGDEFDLSEPETEPFVDPEPWQDPEPWVSPDGKRWHRQAMSDERYKPRYRAVSDIPAQPATADRETIARYLARAGLDWVHNDCGEDEHDLGHTNWEAWLDDADELLASGVLKQSPENLNAASVDSSFVVAPDRIAVAVWLYENSDVSTPIVDEATETSMPRPWGWLGDETHAYYLAKADALLASGVLNGQKDDS